MLTYIEGFALLLLGGWCMASALEQTCAPWMGK